MANDDIDLKQQVVTPNKRNNDFLKTIIIIYHNLINTWLQFRFSKKFLGGKK